MIFFLFFLQILSQSLEEPYFDAAIIQPLLAFDKVKHQRGDINESSQPIDKGPASLRVTFLQFYNLLNFYVYAYPSNPNIDQDKFFIMTNAAFAVYISLGNFKDLGFFDYTENDRINAINDCIDKLEAYDRADQQNEFIVYIKSASKTTQLRDKKYLSPFMWRQVPSVPQNEKPVKHALNELCRGIFLILIENYKHLIELPDDLWKNVEDSDYSHMYRFTLRSIVTTLGQFPTLFTPRDSCEKESLLYMAVVYERLGYVNDLVVSYHEYLKTGNKVEAEKKKHKKYLNFGLLLNKS